jgi:hypothetical protein
MWKEFGRRQTPCLYPAFFIAPLLIFDPYPSVADPDPGSGVFLLPGSGINFLSDQGFRIPDPARFLAKFSYIIFRILVQLSL